MKFILFSSLMLLNISLGYSQTVLDLANDAKAYKEAKAITTLNVNKIIAEYEDGMTIYHDPQHPSKRKAIFTKIDSGKKDFEGNTIFYLQLTDDKTNDTIILVPNRSFYPTSYSVIKYLHSSERYPIGGLYDSEYTVYEVNRKVLYGSSSSFGQKPVDVTLSSHLAKKIEYDRKDLLNEVEEKQYLGYIAMIDDHFKSVQTTNYQEELLKCIQGEYIYFGYGRNGTNVKLKVKKVFSGSELTEIILIKPFVDGSYPEKEEFYIRAQKDKHGVFRFNSKYAVSFNDDKTTYYSNPGILIPFNGVLLCMNDTYNGYASKAGNFTFTEYRIGSDQIKMLEVHDIFNYAKSGGFEEQWKLKNVTTNYDRNNLYELKNYVAFKLLPHLLN